MVLTVTQDLRPDGRVAFLSHLEDLRVPEDTAVVHDSMRFLDFERLEHPSGAVQFKKGQERLTVINVNRQPLERTLGADLIYINETCESFVLIQYKTMRSQHGEAAGYAYRPDRQLAEELERLHKISAGSDDGTPEAYRLNPGCAYLKLCKPVSRVDAPVRDLVTGIYLPLDYYDVLTASDEVKGPRGGVVLGYDTIHRTIGNDLFVALVGGSWIGTRTTTTKKITDIVLAGLSADRSVTVASATVVEEFDNRDR